MGPSYWMRLTFLTLTPCQKERVTHILRTWRWTYMVCSVCRDLFPTWDYVQLIEGSCTSFSFPMFDIMGFRKEWRLIVSEEEKDFNGVFTFNEHFTIHLVVKARENSSHKIEIYFIRKLLLLSLVLLLWTCYSKNLPSSIQSSLLLRYSVNILSSSIRLRLSPVSLEITCGLSQRVLVSVWWFADGLKCWTLTCHRS